MIMRPEQQLPEKIPALHTAGHALRAVAYGAGSVALAKFGLGDFPHALNEVHQNFSLGLLHEAGDAAMLLSSLHLAKGSLKNIAVGAMEVYYNITGMGREANRYRRSNNDSNWV